MKSTVTSSSKKIYAALQLPPKCLQMYNHFITSNQSAVTSIESTLRSLTYVIPGRFRDAELASESLHCSIQLLSLYHDKVLLRSDASLPSIPSVQTPHNRYTNFWYQRSRYYRRVALLLNVIQYTKLLWEMVAKRRGEKARWRIVVILEIMEAVCKLNLLQITKSRSPVNPPFPIREVLNHSDSSIAEEDGITGDSPNTQFHTTPKEYQLKRTGMKLPTLPNPKDISGYLLSRVLSADDIKAPSTLLNQLHGSVYAAEVLYILQPVIYAIILSLKKDKSSWQPWAIGISIDYLIRYLRKKDNFRATALEKEQWARRNWALAWWIMRGAFYEKFTKGLLHRTSESLPNFFAAILDDYLYLWDGYYSSTSF